MNEEPQNPGIDPELEARIVALVLGEASDFEIDALSRLIELRPELAAFKLRMQEVHGLLQNVGVGEFEAPDEDWKLPTDRRNAVLAVIRGETTIQPADDLSRRAGDVNPLIDHVDTAEIRGLTSPARLSLIADDGLSADVAKNKSPRRLLRHLINVLAVVCVAVATMFYSFSSQERSASEYFYAAAKTDEPREGIDLVGGTNLSFQLKPESAATSSVLLGRSPILRFNAEPMAEQKFARSGSSDVDNKKSSETALSALQHTLNSGAMVSSDGDLPDDVQAVVSGSESLIREKVVAQHGANTLEEGRGTIIFRDGSTTFESEAFPSPPATDSSVVIAENSTGVTSGELGYDARDGLAGSKPAAPHKGEVAFPDSVDSWGDVSDSAPAGTVRLRANAPDGDSVLLGEIKLLSPGESAPIVGGIETSTPRIIIGNEEEVVGETSLELATSDLPSQLPDLQHKPGQLQYLNRNESVADFSKDKAGLGAAENKIDGERLGKEAKPMDSLSFAGTADDSPMADKNLARLLSESDDGLRTDAQANDRFGRARFGGDFGAIGSDRPGVLFGNLNIEMPADAQGDATQIPEGIANFDPILKERSQAEVSGRDSLARTKSAEDSAGKQSLDSFQEAIRQPGDEKSGLKGFVDVRSGGEPSGSTSQPMTLYGEATKSGQTDVAGIVTEEFEQKWNRGGMVSSGGAELDNSLGVDLYRVVPRSVPTPNETPALRSSRLSIPGTKVGDGIPDSREQESTVPPAPVTGKATAQPKSEEMPIIDGFNSSGKVIMNWEKDEKLQERRESGVKGSTHWFFRQGATARPAVDDDSELKKPAAKTVAPSAGLNETTAAAEAFSTFSLHVSDVSFKLAAAALARGEWPEAAKIRIEEFVNAFDYGDPLPHKGEKVACAVEQSIHPFVQQRNLLRVSMRTAAEGRASNTPLRLTFLLDNSGSMERTDRQETVRRAFALLSQQLSPIDQVTLISFARQPRLLAEKVSGAESGQLVKLIDELPSEGGTNIEAALRLAFEKATEQQTAGAQNRIILLTDGAVNLGDADPESLSRMVTTMRDAGIAFDAAGISAEGLNDDVLEALTRKGDGRYYLLDSFEDADVRFARQIAGALRPSASNVKVQVEFNPKRVGHYKLLGFEKHILKQEDFRNDKVDAAEMAAAEAGVALYQFEAKPDGEGDVGSVSVRFRDLSTGQMVENRWPIPYEADAPRPDQAAPSLRIAASAALLAAKLRGEPLGETVDLQTLSQLISGLPEQERNDPRVQQLQLMIEQARQMNGK